MNMKNWKLGDRFVNPYNFVPFQKKAPSEADAAAKRRTGYIACGLTVLTPLMIPNTSNPQALHDGSDPKIPAEACSYDFFSHTDLRGKTAREILDHPSEPVIPGSELRGMIRSVFEAAFGGCASVADLSRKLGRRSPDVKQAGILKKIGGKWTIIPCTRLMLKPSAFQDKNPSIQRTADVKTYQDWKEGQEVYVTTNSRKPYAIEKIKDRYDRSMKHWKKGRLHKGEAFATKKSESVFAEQKARYIPVAQREVENLRQAMREYRKIDPNWYPDYLNSDWNPDEASEDEEIMVYYQSADNDDILYLSPACIGKEIFRQDIETLLEKSGVAPCADKKNLCRACALFGMVAKEKTAEAYCSVGSKLRFEDAVLAGRGNAEFSEKQDFSTYFMSPILLPEMGEPKPGAVEFYTLPPQKKQGGDYGYWTYDYKIKTGGGSRKRIFFKDAPIRLRGRKFYWHSDAWTTYCETLDAAGEPTNMRQKLRPLTTTDKNPAVNFTFNVYFEGVALPDLQRLCRALALSGPDCAHKLGRGKPLGFGSVQINVESVHIRKIDPESGLWTEEQLPETDWRDKISSTSETEALKTLEIMMHWTNRFSPKAENPARRADVRYPQGEGKQASSKEKTNSANAKASHQWFRGNRVCAANASGTKPLFAKILPNVQEEAPPQQDNTERAKETSPWLYALKEN